MMSKHGHKSLGRCKQCNAEIYEKNGKIYCPNCGDVSKIQISNNSTILNNSKND